MIDEHHNFLQQAQESIESELNARSRDVKATASRFDALHNALERLPRRTAGQDNLKKKGEPEEK